MAQKRMFSLSVVDTDAFLEMPITSRLLYYELGMRADDDGFVNNWKKILLFTGLKEDDLKILILKNFIIPFESGVIVIRHWRMNNYLQNDRTKPTIYQEEKAKLELDKNNVYKLDTTCIHRIEENRIEKNRLVNKEEEVKEEEIFQIYEENFSTLSPTAAETLISLIETYTGRYVKEALKRAIINNKKSLAYVKGILKQWKDKTWDEVINEGSRRDVQKRRVEELTVKPKRMELDDDEREIYKTITGEEYQGMA